MTERLRLPYRQIRADFDDQTVVVYQAYNPQIAQAALSAGTFVAPFSLSRMTWIKPSFLWMMYRCGWAGKSGQERVLAVRITRDGFEDALGRSCLSHYEPGVYADHADWQAVLGASPVRIQWDPERTVDGAPLQHRSVQIGLGGDTVTQYVSDWIVGITDLTDSLPGIRSGLTSMPTERPYPLSADLARRIGATQ